MVGSCQAVEGEGEGELSAEEEIHAETMHRLGGRAEGLSDAEMRQTVAYAHMSAQVAFDRFFTALPRVLRVVLSRFILKVKG